MVSRTSSELSKVYYFDGCFAKFEEQVKKNREVVIWATVGAALILVTFPLLFKFDILNQILGGDVAGVLGPVHDGRLRGWKSITTQVMDFPVAMFTYSGSSTVAALHFIIDILFNIFTI